MNPEDRERVRINYCYLEDRLVMSDLLGYLFQEGIIDMDIKDEIEAEGTRKKKATKFLNLFMRHNGLKNEERALQVLYEALNRSECGHIKHKLQQTEVPAFRDGAGIPGGATFQGQGATGQNRRSTGDGAGIPGGATCQGQGATGQHSRSTGDGAGIPGGATCQGQGATGQHSRSTGDISAQHVFQISNASHFHIGPSFERHYYNQCSHPDPPPSLPSHPQHLQHSGSMPNVHVEEVHDQTEDAGNEVEMHEESAASGPDLSM